MADNPGSIVEIRAGTSQRPLLELKPGQVVQPMSIGRVGMWPIEAPGVLDVHAYVYFDGNALFIQSADQANPAKGNGQAIGATWQQIEIPCTIELGRARLVYRTLDEMEEGDEDKTVAQAIQLPVPPPPRGAPPPPQFTANAGAFSNRKQGPDSDATRLQPMGREPDPTVVSPLEMAGTPIGGVPKARPAAGMPALSTDMPPQSQPTQIGAPPAPPPPQNMGYAAFGSVQVAVPAAPPPPNPMMQTFNAPMQQPMQQNMMGMQPMQMQGMQGAPPGMMQPGMMQPGMMQPGMMQPGMMPQNMMPQMGAGAPGMETGRIVPPGELKGLDRALAEWKAMPPIRKVIVGTFPGVLLLVYFMLFDDDPQQQARKKPNGATSSSVSASATAPPPPVVDAGGPIIVTNPPPVLDAGPGPVVTNPSATTTTTIAPPLPKGKVTLERQAMDLVGQGQYTKAADIYDQLANQAQTPAQQATYREAARILRTR
jgi:hypothetical protein